MIRDETSLGESDPTRPGGLGRLGCGRPDVPLPMFPEQRLKPGAKSTQQVRRLHIKGNFIVRSFRRLLMTTRRHFQQMRGVLRSKQATDDTLLHNELAQGESRKPRSIR